MDKYEPFRQAQKRKALRRANRMRAMQHKGKTLEQIGEHFGISRQRVHQILATHKEAS